MSEPHGLELEVLPDRYAVCRLPPDEPWPAALLSDPLVSLTRTDQEVSLVCSESRVPEGVPAECGWRWLRARGPLDFAMTGVVASLAGPLAQAGISVFVLSSYLTDHLLVKETRLGAAVEALRSAGHRITLVDRE